MSSGRTHCCRRLLHLLWLWLWLLNLLKLRLLLLKPRGLHSHLRCLRSILTWNCRNRRNSKLSLLWRRSLKPTRSKIPSGLSLQELRWLLLEGRLLRLWVSRLLGDLVLRWIALLTRGLLSRVAVVHCGNSTRATRARVKGWWSDEGRSVGGQDDTPLLSKLQGRGLSSLT
jgi:hypothetical protein